MIISESGNRMLARKISTDEVHDAVFNINDDSSPGPDDFGANFFKLQWEEI